MTTKSTERGSFVTRFRQLSPRFDSLSRILAPNVTNSSSKHSARRTILICTAIFLLATGVRLLHWQDMRPLIENGKMYFGMTGGYQADAENLLAGRLDLFIGGPSPPSDAKVLNHPPGYSLLLALIFKLFGNSDTPWRLIQILFDALAAAIIFLIAGELLPRGVAILSGVLVALSPQLAHNSLVLLPDSPSILPIVLAMFLFTIAFRRRRVFPVIGAGLLIGISCWIRPNALLLSPFLAVVVFFLFERGRRWRYALALVVPTILVIMPITLRNIFFFHTFNPISLTAGLNLCAGIADYDDEQRFGQLSKDHQVMQWEAQFYNRPEYARSLLAPDGIERDRERFKRGFAVIKSHPFWFGGVMLRRVGFMLTFEPQPIISRVPVVTHSLAEMQGMQPVWISSPRELLASSPFAQTPAKVSLSEDEQTLVIAGDDSEQAQQFIARPIAIEPGRDYVLKVPFDVMEGRMVVQITKSDGRSILASAAVPDALQGFPPGKEPSSVDIPFASGNQSQMQIVISNGGSKPVRPTARLGKIELFALGESSYGWTRLPRLLVRSAQKFYVTRWMLPLISFGLLLLILARRTHAVLILISVPLYYLTAQAPLHTEYRYVIAIQYFLFVLAAVTLYLIVKTVWKGAQRAAAFAIKQRSARAVS